MTKSQIVRGAIISYLAIAVNFLITIFYTPWMIRQIGVSDYGLYSLVTTFLSYFLLDYGLANTITRFIAKYRAEGNIQKIGDILGLTNRLYLIIDGIILLVLVVLYFFIDNFFTGLTADEIERFKILYCISGVFAVLNFIFKPLRGVLSAFELFVINKTLDLIIYVGTVLLIIIALLFNCSVYTLVLITGITGFLASLLRYYYFLTRTKVRISWGYYDKQELKELTSFSKWIMINQFSNMLRITLVPTILGIVSCSEEIAVFSVGRGLVNAVWTIAAALNGLFLPKVTRMASTGNLSEITNLMIRVGRLQLYVMMAIFAGFCVFGQTFISLWVGDKFADVYWVFILIVYSNLITHTLQVGMDLVYTQNRVKDTAKMMLSSSIIGLVFTFILSPKYGALGASIATGTALFLTQMQYVRYFHKVIGLDMKKFFRECHLSIMPLLVIFSILFYSILTILNIDTWIQLGCVVVVYIILFIMICIFFIMNKEELLSFKRMLRIN